MKSRTFSFLKVAVILLASATLGIAQTSGYYNNQQPASQNAPTAESVRPGALNYVEGQVSVDGQTLGPQAVGRFALQQGQALDTGNGYAEVLLTPGAFLRIGPNTEFRLTTAGLADTGVTLVHGEALLEVDQLINGTRLTVGIGNGSADVLKKGLYSFDTNQQAVRVLDGKLRLVAAAKSREIGKEDQILLANGDNLKKTDFSMSQAKLDPLYVWSEARNRDEAGQNRLVAENPNGYAPVGAGWFWNPYAEYYGFWPSAYLYSPFGFGFYGGYYPGFFNRGYYPGFYGRAAIRYGQVAGFHARAGFQGRAIGGGFHGGGGHR